MRQSHSEDILDVRLPKDDHAIRSTYIAYHNPGFRRAVANYLFAVREKAIEDFDSRQEVLNSFPGKHL